MGTVATNVNVVAYKVSSCTLASLSKHVLGPTIVEPGARAALVCHMDLNT